MADNDEDDLFGNDDEVMKEEPSSQPTENANTNNNNQIDVNAIANLVQEAGGGATTAQSTTLMLKQHPPPDALPAGWYLKPSISSPGNFYYFNQDTGLCQWEYPTAVAAPVMDSQQAVADNGGAAVSQESLNATAAAAAMAVQSILKRGASDITSPDKKKNEPAPPQKRAKTSSSSEKDQKLRRSNSGSKRDRHHSSSSHDPKEVRVLHILKKHRGSRRPASWRNPKITDTKEKAISDLRELLSVLNESKGDKKELRATFEELAKTESDCSSAKRGGDLGYFGRKKMQPAFEKASFGLRVGQLSDIVDTSSGVHLILRLG